jgi:hypothetical protein
LGNLLFIRVPLPAAMMTTSIGLAMRFPLNFLTDFLNASRRAYSAAWRKTCLRIMVLLTVAFLLPACSAIKLAYNQSPSLAYWYLDDYVDFTGVQSLQVKADMAQLQTWHRQTQLPGYIAMLQKIETQLPGEISPAQACKVFEEVRTQITTLSIQAAPIASTLALTLKPAQLAKIQSKFDKENTEYREDYIQVSAAQLREKRLEMTVSRSEKLYGRLDSQQISLIGQLLDSAEFDASQFYKERLRRQQDTLKTFAKLANIKATNPELATAEQEQNAVRELVGRSLKSPNTTYSAYQEKFMQDSCRFFSAIHASTSAPQRAKAQQVLSGYQQDMRTLYAQRSN